jgi:nucleotide-binding universal stress UspA family protein
MIKDIVVNLNVGAEANWASNYAISVASELDAHLTGIVLLYGPIMPVSRAGYVPPELEVVERHNEAAVEAARKEFTAASGRAGIKAEALTLSAGLVSAGDQFGQITRRFGLAIVGQPEPGANAIEQNIVEAALFDSGGPVIIVPYIQKTPLKLDHVMVCWDGDRAAARAIRDALPFLRRAGRVEVVIVSNEPGKQDQIERIDIGAHLARHYGLNVVVKRMPLGDVDVAAALLSHAADESADFIVMGGYGHSRLREFVLGGVTRSMLRTMIVAGGLRLGRGGAHSAYPGAIGQRPRGFLFRAGIDVALIIIAALQLHAVRVGKIDRIVVTAIVFAGWIEHRHAVFLQKCAKRVDIIAAGEFKRIMVKPDIAFAVFSLSALCVGGCDPEQRLAVTPAGHVGIIVLAPEAKKAKQLVVEVARARDVTDAQHQMINADDARHSRSPGDGAQCKTSAFGHSLSPGL